MMLNLQTYKNIKDIHQDLKEETARNRKDILYRERKIANAYHTTTVSIVEEIRELGDVQREQAKELHDMSIYPYQDHEG
jgi:hypothetical protein